MDIFDKPLFIYEMANNHQGSVEHGKRIIRELRRVRAISEQISFCGEISVPQFGYIHPSGLSGQG